MPPAKVVGLPFQAIVPVYWLVSVIAVSGVAPVTGAVTPGIAAMLTICKSLVASQLAVVPLFNPSQSQVTEPPKPGKDGVEGLVLPAKQKVSSP